MDTSNESFVWSDASSDSSKNIPFKIKQDDTGQSSDYDTAYKKVLPSIETDSNQNEQRQRGRKQKRLSVSDELENHDTVFQINSSIKSELNRDFDVSRKNKKLNYNEASIFNQCDESLYDAENYLNLRVKQEKETSVEPVSIKSKKKKKSKAHGTTNEDQKSDIPIYSKPFNEEIDIGEHNLDSTSFANFENCNISETNNSYRQKKKKVRINNYTAQLLEASKDTGSDYRKKKKKKSKNIRVRGNDDSELLEASEYTNRKKKKIKPLPDNCNDNDHDHDNELQHEIDEKGKIVSSTLINNSICINTEEEYNNYLENDCTLLNDSKSTGQISLIEGPLKRSNRISDRIRFEDDSADFEPKESILSNDFSIQVKQFINSNSNLTPLHGSARADSVITSDDEIWLVRAPHEVSTDDLNNTNLTLNSRKKLKLNGKTYESIIDNSASSAAILLYSKKNMFVKHMPLMGVINLRKQIPKVHIPYQSLMVQDNNCFIPLPETKCRHPLFGNHYKKATKIPAVIAERLSTARPSAFGVNSKKKIKHKKAKLEVESDIEVKPNTELLYSENKKRKRKRNHENNGSKKKKRFKQDPGSADAWASEQAIEMNLFNF